MKFEEPTSNTAVSGKTKTNKILKKNYNLTYFENMFVFKDVLCPHLKCHDNNDYTILSSDLSPIDFYMVRLVN